MSHFAKVVNEKVVTTLFHAGVFPEEMTEKIQAVKEKYPKPK